MAMKPLAFEDNGKVNVRAVVPLNLWAVLMRVGRTHAELVSSRRITDERAGIAGLTLLLRQIAEHFEDGNATYLTQDFQKALKALAEMNFGSTSIDGEQIDISQLHVNKSLKSGFVGVYANGLGFRAVSKDFSGKAVVIGTYKTAEEAAHRRLAYHRANNLAYGELENEMATWRADTNKWGISAHIDDEALIRQIKDHCATAHTTDAVFGPGSATIEPTFSSKLPKRDQARLSAPPAPVPRQLAAPPEPEPGTLFVNGHSLGPAIKHENGTIEAGPQLGPTGSADGVTPFGFELGDVPPGWE